MKVPKLGWKVWLLIALLIASFIAINPTPFKSGVLVKHVDTNSTEREFGLQQGEVIIQFNGQPINNIEDYSRVIDEIPEGESKKVIVTAEAEYVFVSNGKPKITVSDVPKSNLRAGLDLVGGSRAIVKPEIDVTDEQLEELIATMENRFNVYGISDVRVRSITDLDKNKFVLIEVAGATIQDLDELISQQGKFEAKIGEEVIFIGGERDVTSVCRFDPSCSGIRECSSINGVTICTYQFTVFLSEDAARRHADITDTLSSNLSAPGYLDSQLDLFIDDTLVDSLLISENLKGLFTTRITVSGSGRGTTREAALEDAQISMNRLQTVLITGSLPFKLKIEKLDSISSIVGEKLFGNILTTLFAVFLAVSLFIFIRYRNLKIVLPVIFTIFSEVVLILGIASVIKWNLDLASIAGILVVIGTGLDHQIIILDEINLGKIYGWKEKMRRAFFIIVGAFATTFVAMLPLAWAGAGLLKGFAVTTLIGITVGILITRPAFADMIKKILKN